MLIVKSLYSSGVRRNKKVSDGPNLQELQAAHELLNQMKVPNAQTSPAGTARPLNLGERIQVLYNLKSEEAKAQADPGPQLPHPAA